MSIEHLYGVAPGRRVTLRDLQRATDEGQPWPILTAYDALTAGLFERAGVPALLVGDSAAMVVYGYDSTVPVTMDELMPLVRGVVRGTSTALVIADLPFGSYEASPTQALETASAFMKEGGAHAVKLEGGSVVLPQIEMLISAGVPVVGHLGLTPQSVHQLGGYRVQGRGESGQALLSDAKSFQTAGVSAIVLEAVPAELAARVSEDLTIPIIGIGAGAQVDAQILVWQDLLGVTERSPKFVQRYAELGGTIHEAVHAWVQDVRHGTFPSPDHWYA
jgi:3-methyl-2-oxobutanoate hydroxymethyltransferase